MPSSEHRQLAKFTKVNPTCLATDPWKSGPCNTEVKAFCTPFISCSAASNLHLLRALFWTQLSEDDGIAHGPVGRQLGSPQYFTQLRTGKTHLKPVLG